MCDCAFKKKIPSIYLFHILLPENQLKVLQQDLIGLTNTNWCLIVNEYVSVWIFFPGMLDATLTKHYSAPTMNYVMDHYSDATNSF